MGNLRGWELPILLAIILLLFGARRLPDLARGVAKSLKIFKSEVKDGDATPTTPGSAEDDGRPSAPETPGASTRDDAAAARSGAEPDDDGERPRG